MATKRNRITVAKPTFDEILASRTQLNQVRTDFLKIDADTGLTFTSIALQADSGVRKERNRRSARKAYNMLLRLITKVELTAEDARVIGDKMRRLKSDLIDLGEAL